MVIQPIKKKQVKKAASGYNPPSRVSPDSGNKNSIPPYSTSARPANPYSDTDIVGSGNQIDDFDGTSTRIGKGNSVESGLGGGGGGTGSGLAGRESVGLVGETSGKSMEDIVYGVKRKNAKARNKGRSL